VDIEKKKSLQAIAHLVNRVRRKNRSLWKEDDLFLLLKAISIAN
jgi:hypothetical protein